MGPCDQDQLILLLEEDNFDYVAKGCDTSEALDINKINRVVNLGTHGTAASIGYTPSREFDAEVLCGRLRTQ